MHALDGAWDVVKREFDSACAQNARAARNQITNELNQLFRRLRQYRGESEWVSILLDSASRFVDQAALFELNEGVLKLRGQHKLELPGDLSFPLSAAAAFAGVAETKDPVVALRSVGEVSNALSNGEPVGRAHLFPVMNGVRVVAVLFAPDSQALDANALELITGLASAVLERSSNRNLHSQIAPPAPAVSNSPQAAAPVNEAQPKMGGKRTEATALPGWADLGEEARTLHIRAQRFARVAVAEMQLSRPEACQAGRDRGNLYLFLKNEIEKARDSYRQQFMVIPTMVDYLHLELVRTAAEGDEAKLGEDYPGRLV